MNILINAFVGNSGILERSPAGENNGIGVLAKISFNNSRMLLEIPNNVPSINRKMSDQALHDDYLSKVFQTIWDSVRSKRRSYKSIRATLPRKNMTLVFIIEQWYRMYKSYRPGLFNYYAFPIEERTNSKMEQHFGQEKMKFIQRSGKPNVSRQIRVRGGTELKIQYSSKVEINNYLDQIEGSYSHKDVLEGLKELQERQKIESNRWQSKMGGKDALRSLFEPGKKKKKRT
ncbi:hypothetical protein ES708_30454 [subsurface metagenome]